MQEIDAEQVISKAAPGFAIYGRFCQPGQNWETGFFIQEERKYLDKLGKNPVIGIRGGCLVYDNIPLVATLILVNNDFDLLYEVWWNYRRAGGAGPEYFRDMATQERVVLFFYRGAERIRNISIRNKLRDGFKAFLTEILKYPAWFMQDFDQARELVYQDFPTVRELWDRLAKTDLGMN